MEIEVLYSVMGSIGTNCYILKNSSNGEGVLIDTADDYDAAERFVEKSGCKLAAVLLTHGHYDHMTVARQIAGKFGVKIYAGENERDVLDNPEINLSAAMGRKKVSLKADYWVKDNEELILAGIKIKAFYTPGHTCGGMSFYVPAIDSLFSGDTLFAESVGRTDFPTGSMSQIVNSIKTKLFALPEKTVVYPGHGDGTSIGHEKAYNPFCQ